MATTTMNPAPATGADLGMSDYRNEGDRRFFVAHEAVRIPAPR
jgi:hypothetical protein